MKISEILLQAPTKVPLTDIIFSQGEQNNIQEELKEEVLKGLLRKTDEGNELLSEIYNEKEMLMRNLVVINDSFIENVFVDKDTFLKVFPFVPYQFKLIVDVVNSLVDNELLIGEIPLTETFRGVLLRSSNNDLDQFVPFNIFYDFTKEFMTEDYKNILKHEFPLEGNSLEEKVLKVLLLVNEIDWLPSTLDNIATLLVTNIKENRMNFKIKVKDALNSLIAKGIILEKAGVYKVLSIDEQRVNREIEARYVTDEIYDSRLYELLFEDLFHEIRKRLTGTEEQDFENLEYELNGVVFNNPKNSKGKLSIYSGFYRDLGEDALVEKSAKEGSILLILPKNMLPYTELLNVLKLEDFLSEYRGEDFSKLQKALIKRFGNLLRDLAVEIEKANVFERGKACL